MGVPVAAWESGGVGEWHPGPLVAWGDVTELARVLREAVNRRASVPPGYDRRELMGRLVAAYGQVAASAALAPR
jgi:hypothetical protein